MPVPEDQQYWAYPPTFSPATSTDPSLAKPIASGSVAAGGALLSIQVSAGFAGPVDAYFGIYAQPLDPVNIYILRTDYTFQPLSMGLSPWKTNVVSINEGLFGSIPVSGLPYGKYTLYLVVTPAGTIDNYYLYETYFEISEGTGGDTYDVDANGIPGFVKTDYIELVRIGKISRFRSAAGHDYSDDFETCRSMKHYFNPVGTVDWSSIKISSPVRGTVHRINQEWAGTQIWIKSIEFPAFYFIIFHINLTAPLSVGDSVSEGQQLGTHIGSQTMSDIAVGVNTPGGWKLISYFDTMTDSVFQGYQARGISSREALIISRTARDADPLICDGETFLNTGSLENWVTLY